MARNSEIDRAGRGQQVREMYAAGSTAAEIAKSMPETISPHSVRRYLAKQSISAATLPPPTEEAVRVWAAAVSGLPDSRDSATSSYYGVYRLNTSNNFTKYYGIARGIGNGQVLRAFKNISLKITNGARIVGDERDADKIEALSHDINFSSLLQNVVRYTCEMGTCIVGIQDDNTYVTPSILPIQYYTLLTDAEMPKSVNDTLVHGEVTQIVFDEMGVNTKTFPREDIGLLRLWADGTEIKDTSGRNTFGIYGESMTTGVEIPLKSLLNGAYYYDAFIQRYGMGRLWIKMQLLADMIQNEKITSAAAAASRNDVTAAMQKLTPNQDLITTGEDVRMIETKTGFNIVPFFDWRSRQIDRALLQSDVGAGDVGNAWTSAGVAVSAQDYDSFKSLRETLFDQVMNEIIAPRLPEYDLNPKTISITATPFLRVDVPFQDLIEMHDRGIITEQELRDRAGFPIEKPDEA